MKRLDALHAPTPAQAVLAPLAGLLGALVLTAVAAVALHHEPVAALAASANAFRSADTWLAIVARAGPLMLSGLAVALSARAGLFNFGGEGQLMAGMAAMATVAAPNPAARLSQPFRYGATAGKEAPALGAGEAARANGTAWPDSQ